MGLRVTAFGVALVEVLGVSWICWIVCCMVLAVRYYVLRNVGTMQFDNFQHYDLHTFLLSRG